MPRFPTDRARVGRPRRREANLFEELGTKPIATLTGPELLATLRTIEERGAHDPAHRVFRMRVNVG